jgi:SpoVK/Ycf46/Vps4 family AAA+-type ATPase
VTAVHLPRPGYSLRVDLWEARRDRLPDEVDTEALAATFRLTAGQIDEAIATAEAVSRGGPLTTDAVYRGCRAQSTQRLGSLARKVDPHYTWDDIVLPESAMTNLREVAAHVTHRGTVYDDWGFDARFSLGNGLTVLFTGPSGTGKTMAAEIIAQDAGLDLYKIDLAKVVNKYIGETEKNLGRIFDEAADSDAILFFDEADALFGERTEVQDAHDRYANIEVNYLLQRVEEHDGTVVLTTNLEGNIDDAFRRRIHLSVEFPLPDRAAREAIWDSIFPAETPVGDLDVEFLSSLSLTGGNIKNVALTGAFLAAEDGGLVEMPHLVRATKREFEKTGNVIDPAEFGQYRDLIDH